MKIPFLKQFSPIAAGLLLACAGMGQLHAQTNAMIEGFDAYRGRILVDLKTGERYSEISPQARDTVIDALDRMQALAEPVGGEPARLDGEERTAFLADQKTVDRLLTTAEKDSRLVCRREKKTGSHRPVRMCNTVAELRRTREDSRDGMRELMKTGATMHAPPRN